LKIVGWVIGLAAVGALVMMAVAGVSGATGILVTGVAIVSMIALGSLMGGRNTPNKAPYRTQAAAGPADAGPAAARPADAGPAEAGSTAAALPEDDTEVP